MKRILFLFLIFSCVHTYSQSESGIENIIIVTTDGFRWQEVFKGMDSIIAINPAFNQKDSAEIFQKYWATSPEERRKKLMPFIWNTIVENGQIYGNRKFDNKIDNDNPYWFSYPGYSEIFCGYVDTFINSNKYPPNPHTNVLEFLNHHSRYKGRVAAFCAWDAFDRILNESRSGFPVICGADLCGGKNPDSIEQFMNAMKKNSYKPFGEAEYLDVFTHYMAMDYLRKKKPGVLYISYGETDEWAHEEHYKDYLNAANQVDTWLNELWNFVQTTPEYKNKTAIFVTVDHGRGDKVKEKWTSHNNTITDSHEIWFAVMGPGIPSKGEIKTPMQIYQKQFAETFTELLGLRFTCEHQVAEGLSKILTNKH